jgi:hypothetical protein
LDLYWILLCIFYTDKVQVHDFSLSSCTLYFHHKYVCTTSIMSSVFNMRHKDYNFLFNYHNVSALFLQYLICSSRNSNSSFMSFSFLEWWHLMWLTVLPFLNASFLWLLSKDHFQTFSSLLSCPGSLRAGLCPTHS